VWNRTFAIATAKSLDSSTRPLVEGAAAAAAAAAMQVLLLLVGASRAALQLRGCHWVAMFVCRLQDAAAEILRLCMSLATTSCCCGATVLLRSCAECAVRMLSMLYFVTKFKKSRMQRWLSECRNFSRPYQEETVLHQLRGTNKQNERSE
jgi:hypothetical protein